MASLRYTLAVLALLPWAVVHLVWRGRRQPEYLRHWGERFGYFGAVPASLAECRPEAGPFDGRRAVLCETPVSPVPTFWIHAVSVGETRAAQPVVKALRQRYPEHRIVFTHMTPTGRETSLALYGDSVERVYLPYDTPWAMRRFLRHFRPELGLIMETELWPNLIAACKQAGVPLHLVNARLSARSARRYARFPALARRALQDLAGICAQSADDAERLQALGATAVTVTGNVKFDLEVPAAQLALGRELRARCGPRPVWIAASTREGEEALILAAWRKVGASGTALLVLVPRHPQRFDAVAALARSMGFGLQRRSENADIATATQVLLGDSMGEMFAYYAMADLAFVGGSLLDFGSQNLIEPCAVGTPVLVGPSTRNFADAAHDAVACGAALAISDADELAHQVVRLLADATARSAMGAAGREFATRHRGATQRTLAALATLNPAAR